MTREDRTRISLLQRSVTALRRRTKSTFHRMRRTRSELPDTVFVFGCQRSGTTMILDTLERDWSTTIFRDVSELGNIVLRPDKEVRTVLARTRSQWAIAKPLADSHRVIDLLSSFERARGLWMFRHHLAVAHSDLRLFGDQNGIRNLQGALSEDSTNWRTRGVTPGIREMVERLSVSELSELDAALLFWLVRNSLFFEQKLDRHPRVRLVSYERVTAQPLEVFGEIYSWLGKEPPQSRLTNNIRPSPPPPSGGESNPAILMECERLLERLEAARASQDIVLRNR